ncbi:hypothetical protein, partial [Cellvibrio sp. QJXJ]|uniref:hypothetical protein n=1 Tax=Cellvibrio sp. QJXJ TaxID=2964606 RepID=UPI0021C406C0
MVSNVKLPWLDFTKHNEYTGENVRAFSVNHPVAGRLVVIKGLSNTFDSSMRSIGFSFTKDGSFVIKASQLNVAALQSKVIPMLAMKEVSLSDIDLTVQFTQSQSPQVQTPSQSPAIEQNETNAATATTRLHPGLNWLSRSSRAQDNEQYSLYDGILPTTVAESLWSYLDDTADKEELLNGQTLYRGAFDGKAFLIIKRTRLLGSAQKIRYFEAESPTLIPDPAIRLQAPAVFQLSDTIKSQLDEIDRFYGFKIGTFAEADFTPSRKLNNKIAQNTINASDEYDGAITSSSIATNRPM